MLLPTLYKNTKKENSFKRQQEKTGCNQRDHRSNQDQQKPFPNALFLLCLSLCQKCGIN